VTVDLHIEKTTSGFSFFFTDERRQDFSFWLEEDDAIALLKKIGHKIGIEVMA
jgi:hypothetical protein